MRKLILLPLLVALALGLGGNAHPDDLPKPSKWSDLRGRITWEGDRLPEVKKIAVGERDRECCLKSGPIVSEEWVINRKNRGVCWVFVWLEPDPKTGPKDMPVHPDLQTIKTKEVVIGQSGCRYVPHAFAMREGQILVVKNADSVPHNCNFTPSLGSNLLPPSLRSKFKNLEAQKFPYVLNCNIHPWMRGWLWVFNHPYFANTDSDGRFQIKQAPVGNWRLKVWHEAVGWRRGAAGKDGEKIEIKNQEITDLGNWRLNP